MADDILDVTASTEELGKTAGKDLDADKTTYPKLLGLDRSREARWDRGRDRAEIAPRSRDDAPSVRGLRAL